MNRREIEEKLADIFVQRFSKHILDHPEMQDAKLLGKGGIPARELLHVYVDVQNTFGISIPEDDIAAGRFDTFTHIVDIIAENVDDDLT